MVKLVTLSNNQLKGLLRENELETQGPKAEMVERLIKHYGTYKVEKSTLDRLIPTGNSAFQDQLDSLKTMMQGLIQAVEDLRAQTNNGTTNEATPQSTEVVTNAETQPSIANGNNNENADQGNVYEGSVASWHAQRHYSVREIADTIPEFDPTLDTSLSVEQFVQHVEGARIAYGWDDKSLLLAIYGRLRGAARMWFDCRPSLFTNWVDFKCEIEHEFGTSFDEAEISSNMTKATRRADEKIIDYCFRINTLGKRYNLSESAIIRYAREGLKHRDLQNVTAAMKFSSMKQFRETISEYFSNLPPFAPRQSSNMNVRSDKRDQPAAQKLASNEIICYNCNAKGHI